MRRFGLLYLAPVLILLVAVMAPLIAGRETLVLRDILNTHFEMKVAQAEALRAGYMPEIDPYRAGGQPLAGNPNAVPFYPDNLLYLVASPLWAVNAHFWLHLLLAPLAAFWMARAWGLGREGSWAVGVCYAFSGYFLSNLSFYNLVAGVALAPALVAACLLALERRWWAAPAAGGLWALLLLAGDPLIALQAFLLAAAAVLVRTAPRRLSDLLGQIPLGPLSLAFAAGTLIAAPQLVEFLRILALSYRGHKGYTPEVGTVASFDPRQAVEWLVPLIFGRPDRIALGSFWGEAFYTDVAPYYFSLYPGLLALVLVAAAGRPRRRAAIWAWAAAAVGLFLALGRFNPLAAWLFEAAGGSLLRYPIKWWLPVAVGAALLAGVGFERVFRQRWWRPAAWAAAVLVLSLGGLWLLMVLAPGPTEALLRGVIPEGFTDAFVAYERLRWARACLVSLAVLILQALTFGLLRRRPRVAGAAILTVHAATQLVLLAPLRSTDSVLPYQTPPPALEHIPPGARLAHGGFTRAFGPSTLRNGRYLEPEMRFLSRRTFYELYPSTAALWGHRYELNVSPEGLDSFVSRMAEAAVEHSEDVVRLRLLRAWGVEMLLLGRELAPDARAAVEEVARLPSYGEALWIYRLLDPAADVYFAGRVERAPHMNAAYGLLGAPGFDVHRTAVLPGEGPPTDGPGGEVRIVAEAPESLEVAVEATSPGVLVVQRSHLPLWRASVDGREVPLQVANLYRLGVELTPGRHRVRLWIHRRPLATSAALSAAGLLLLALVAVRGRRLGSLASTGDSAGC